MALTMAIAVRTARSPSSSCEEVKPKMPTAASPLNCSTLPPWPRISRPAISKNSLTTLRRISASSCSPRRVDPARSAKIAVTTRRSAASTRAASVVPQAGQKRAPSGTGWPQFGQRACSTGGLSQDCRMATTAETSRARTAVLVEGVSDQLALEALAKRRGRNLEAEGVFIVPMGGATNIGTFLNRFGPQGLDLKVAGLCDVGEEGDFRRGLERAGFGSNLTRADMERLGFYVCVSDLEDELIRALGAARVEEVVDVQGDLGSFHTLQKQPEWRGRPVEEQLRRFMGSNGRRKIRYARLLVEALDLTQVPRPLDWALAHVSASRPEGRDDGVGGNRTRVR